MRTVSLRRRVTIASLLVLAVALIAFDAFLYVSLRARLTGDLHGQLSERAQLARTLASTLPPRQLAQRLAGGEISARVTTSSGHSYLAVPPAPPAPQKRKRARKPAPPGPEAARAPAAAAPHPNADALTMSQPLPGGERLVLSADRSQIDRDIAGLLLLEAAGTVAVLVAAALALWRILGRALRPLDRTTAVAAAIAHGQARERLSPRRTDTELGRMAHAFDEMLDRLQDALAAAQASEDRMRQFLADAAHELRTPIQAIQAGAESLLRADPDDARRERVTVQMIRDSARAGRLVKDLLTLNRLDTDPELQHGEFDLVELAREQLTRAEVLAPSLQLRYEGPVRCLVHADRDRIAQVITNLLDNARHATADDGTITLTIDHTQHHVSLAISDTGPGIPSEERDRVFERFVRLDRSRTRNAFGSGLGLPIARRIAQAHGGTLRCTGTRDGSGARFELTLPRRWTPGPEVMAPRPPRGNRASPLDGCDAGAPPGRSTGGGPPATGRAPRLHRRRES